MSFSTKEIALKYLQVKLWGHPDDMEDVEKMTQKVKNNGFNPTWNKAFQFSIKVPDLAILEFKVSLIMISTCHSIPIPFPGEGQ